MLKDIQKLCIDGGNRLILMSSRVNASYFDGCFPIQCAFIIAHLMLSPELERAPTLFESSRRYPTLGKAFTLLSQSGRLIRPCRQFSSFPLSHSPRSTTHHHLGTTPLTPNTVHLDPNNHFAAESHLIGGTFSSSVVSNQYCSLSSKSRSPVSSRLVVLHRPCTDPSPPLKSLRRIRIPLQ
ncbi:hypothetical protein GQ43DRAFT_300871 [Delitschia confertaspora ATCC 74209]|uniref:Uncharacterized protein n=1 Tax=Delitschia confertaspora ATCC 74209 TaxID=1513339 RepID=A0A9P4JU31_9PLEO|nr:hypothetical protein GQ43DRAFT_300871 [Delitschia confertaspora ATCC 74209]